METLFYRQWRVLLLAVGIIVAAGLSSLLTIARQEDPTITNLFATILTAYPGADPARVEALVTTKIEEELEEIAEIDEIESTSRTGVSVITVQLSKFISDTEIEQAWSEIRDALADAEAQLPAGTSAPIFDDDRAGAYTAISGLTAEPGRNVPISILGRYAEILQERLRQIGGTKLVRIYGEPEEEILVSIDPHRLTAAALSADAVSNAIRSADAKVRAGQVRGDRYDFLVEVGGEIDEIARIAAIPLKPNEGGRTLRVGDIATITKSAKQPASSLAFTNGTPAILVAARMDEDRQVDVWVNAVKDVLAEFEAELPGGLRHELLFDQSEYTTERLNDLIGNMAIGIAIVVSVLFFTLGWRGALIVALILPLTSLLSLSILLYIGLPIHQMSVTGLIVALGLLVDSAIVMTDEIHRRLKRKMEREQAVGASVRRLAAPLLASTATTILAFMPMALLPGPAGDFVGSIAMAVIVMLGSSFFLALTVTPALGGWLLTGEQDDADERWWVSGIRAERLVAWFSRSMDFALANRGIAIFGAVALPLVGFLSFPTLTADFFPETDRDQFYVQLELEGTAAIDRTADFAMTANGIIARQEGIREVNWVVGESAPAFYYNMRGNQDGVSSFAEALVTTASPETTEKVIPLLQAQLDAALPAARILVRGLKQGPPVAAPLELKIVGPDLEILRGIGEEIRALMTEVPYVIHTTASLNGGKPKVVLDLDEERVRAANLDLTSVARQLETALEGTTGGSLLEATEELPVRVRFGSADRNTLDAIRAIEILPPNAAAIIAAGEHPGIPITALGDIRLVPSESPIMRLDGERNNTVRGYIQLGVLPEEALKDFLTRLDASGIALPPGYRFEIGGSSDARSETVRNLMSSMGLIVTLAIAAIVLTFMSFRLSLVAGIVCILSMGLSLLALALFRYPFGVQALIGVIGSIGVSINAAIIIMTALQADDDAVAGDARRIREIVVESGRHIVSTTTTTFGGFLPLIIAGGGFWPPFAMAIAGGVLLSTVVSFYFTPPMFSLMMSLRRGTDTPDRETPPLIDLDRLPGRRPRLRAAD